MRLTDGLLFKKQELDYNKITVLLRVVSAVNILYNVWSINIPLFHHKLFLSVC